MRFRKDFIALGLSFVDRFIAPSQYVAQTYTSAGIAADRIVVIQNGINLDTFSPVITRQFAGPVRILYVGHLGRHKGIDTLIAAMSKLSADHSAELKIVGSGPEDELLRSLVSSLGLESVVQFLPQVPQSRIVDIYSRADVVVLPSVWAENQPVCLMEAMASGLPVIASRKGGIPELISHGHNGLMFEAGNVLDLASQLTLLISSAGLRSEMGQNGRMGVASLDHRTQAAIITSLYNSALSGVGLQRDNSRIVAAIGNFRKKVSDHDHQFMEQANGRVRFVVPMDWIRESIVPLNAVFLLTHGWIARVLDVLRITLVLPWFRRPSRAVLLRALTEQNADAERSS